MKLDVRLEKDDDGDTRFSMNCDKEFSDAMDKCVEGWGIIIRDVITFYGNMRNPTQVHTIQFPEKEEPKSSIRGEVILEEDKEKKADDNSTSGDIIHTDTCARTGTDPPIPDPVGKGDVDAATTEWNGKINHASSK